MFLLFEERYASFLGESDMQGFSSYGFLDLRRDPQATIRAEDAPPPAPIDRAVVAPDDALATTCDTDIVDLLGFDPSARPDAAVRILLDGVDRDDSPACLEAAAPLLGDRDRDGIIDRLDLCPDTPDGVLTADTDGDGLPDAQANTDGDALGDACDPDDDGDGIEDGVDPWPFVVGVPAGDSDGDGVPDADDNCPATPNPLQRDTLGAPGGTGDACADDIEVGLIEQPCLDAVGAEAVHVYCEETGTLDGGGFLRDDDGGFLRDRDGARIPAAVQCPRGSDVIFFTVDPRTLPQAAIDAHRCQQQVPIDDPQRPPLPADEGAILGDLTPRA